MAAAPRTLVERIFEVAAPRAVVWDRLARPATWPSWAHHIRAVDVTPPGLLGPGSVGVVHLRNHVTSAFRMTAFRDGESWTWEGGFLWLRIRYDHVFTVVAPDRTRIAFVVAASGWAVGTIGRLFARIYGGNLDKAIPSLVTELEAAATEDSRPPPTDSPGR